MARLPRRLLLIFHVFGLSCLWGGVFAQLIVAFNILRYGYFRAVEPNLAVLIFEIIIAFYALIYLLFLHRRFLREAGKLVGRRKRGL